MSIIPEIVRLKSAPLGGQWQDAGRESANGRIQAWMIASAKPGLSFQGRYRAWDVTRRGVPCKKFVYAAVGGVTNRRVVASRGAK